MIKSRCQIFSSCSLCSFETQQFPTIIMSTLQRPRRRRRRRREKTQHNEKINATRRSTDAFFCSLFSFSNRLSDKVCETNVCCTAIEMRGTSPLLIACRDCRCSRGVGRSEKREIEYLEPYLDKRTGFTWLPQTDTDYHALEKAHADRKLAQDKRDLRDIPDYLLWSIGNFILFFVLGIVCIILSVRVREHQRTEDYDSTSKLSQRALMMNIFTTVVGISFLVTMLVLLINKSSSNF